ncbi:MAG: acyl-CoA dehydrogenase family protein [Pseudomonadota bacterium]|nr:acyl-CoA dehydrogenase family protein [Pseudomonadota bacterium]
MNFAFSQDQEMIRDSAKRLLSDLSPLSAVHKILDSDATYDEKLWSQMAEAGWPSMAIPEEFGGAGMGYLELAVLAEEMGKALACSPFDSSIFMAAEVIKAAGSEEQKKKYLSRIASGESIATVALSEKGRLDQGGIQLKADGNKLTGVKVPVADGLSADLGIVAARSAEGVSLYAVDLRSAQVSRELVQSMDRARKQARLTFNGAEGELLGVAGKGWEYLDDMLYKAAALIAFEQVGGAQSALEMATNYAKERYAFGRPIGSFQAIKHRIADMFVKVEMARSSAYYAAWALEHSPENVRQAASSARVMGIDAYRFAAEENVQIHGGIGFTWEADPHLHMKRAKHLESVLGGSMMWRERLMQCLEQAAA